MKILLLPLLLAVLTFPSHGWTVENPQDVLTESRNNLLALLYQLQPELEIPDIVGQHFKDLPQGSDYETAAHYVVERQIMSGTSNDYFSPQGSVTRGFVSSVISNSAQADLGMSPNVFSDISQQWYRDSVNWCAQMDIMSGYTENYFAGNDPVTVEQWAVVLYQYGLYQGIAPKTPSQSVLENYSDYKNIKTYAKSAVAWCLSQGLLHLPDEEINPSDKVTRGQVAYGIMSFELLED